MARYTQVFEASGGGVSALEARLEAVLADPPVAFEEIAPLPDCPVAVEFVSLAEDAVAAALIGLGVAPAECAVLTDLAQACASVTRRGAPAPDEEFFTRTGPTGSSVADATEPVGPGAAEAGPHQPAGTPSPDSIDPATAEASVGEEAPAVKGRACSLVGAVGTLSRAAGRLERVLISGTRELTAAQGKLLLADKGVASMDELSPAQTDAWRAEAKKRARTDLELEMGWGAGEIRHLVALANQAASVRGPVGSAMASGEASWRLVRGYLNAAGHLPTHLAAGVANALFGDDESVAATERLTSDREFTGRPWAHKEFYRALDREVAKAEANLEPDERRTKSRAKSLAGADTWGKVDEDGTATFGMSCTSTQLAAISDRLEGAARRARANGDKRTLGQLRAAIGTVLLLRGTVHLDDWPQEDDLITPEQTEQLAAILDRLPAAVLNVIVPLNHLNPDPDNETADDSMPDPDERDERDEGDRHGGHESGCPATGGTGQSDGADDHPGQSGTSRPEGAAPGTDRPEDSAPGEGSAAEEGSAPGADQPESSASEDDAVRGEDSAPGTGEHGPDCACSLPEADPDPAEKDAAPGTRPVGPTQARFGSGVFGVGEVLGRRSSFLPPQEVARLALTPGSVMHRLVTDPLTGRCLERSTKAYPFTPAMKTQIAFADGMCRAPGCTQPAAASQFDHVTEFGTPGGHTCEANGALAHPPHHDQKTKEYLDVVINHRREMTWETLLGKIYRTKAHDYTQYSTMLTEATEQVLAADEEDRREAIDLAIYQALSYKPGGTTRLISDEDEPYGEEQFLAWNQIRLTRRNPQTGRKLNEPNPDIVTAERDRHARATQDPDAGKDPSDSTDTDTGDGGGTGSGGGGGAADGITPDSQTVSDTTPTDPDTPERGPWATPDDTPPPF